MNRSQEIYNKLLAYHGKPDWWSENPYEVMTGAVLVQNTAWGNVEKVLKNFNGKLSPQYVEALPLDELCSLIRPSGFYHAKANSLKKITAWYKQYEYSVQNVQSYPVEKIRKELLAVRGIGEETADVILLYAFYFPVFVVDAYIKRLIERLQIHIKPTNEAIKAYFENGLKKDALLYGNYHALILYNGKKHCRKTPVCVGCPLSNECTYVFTQSAEVQQNKRKG
ncbi:MAG: endonuclease III domain-containing protein [Lachnospiraceae bacterium]